MEWFESIRHFPQTLFQQFMTSWAAAILAMAAVYAALAAGKRLTVAHFGRLADRLHIPSALFLDLTRHSSRFFLLAVALYLGSKIVVWPPQLQQHTGMILLIAALLQAAIWGGRIIQHIVDRQKAQHIEGNGGFLTTLEAVGVVGRILLWLVILLIILDNLGVDVTTLVASLGIGGVAVALAVQNILGDLFASLSIVLDRPFSIGDFIIVGDKMGTVEKIGLKSTRIRSLSGEQIVFSNAELLRGQIRNYQRMDMRRVEFNLSVAHQIPPHQVEQVPALLQAAVVARGDDVVFDRAHLQSIGETVLVYQVVYFVRSPDYNVYMNLQQAINFAIYRAFHAAGIPFGHPISVVQLTGEPSVSGGGGRPAVDWQAARRTQKG